MSVALSDSKQHQITALLLRGAKLEALKVYREATGVSLKEAKDKIEAMATALEPRPVAASDPFVKKSGCFGLIALALAMVLTAVLYGTAG